jgi:hypothetical protein
LNRTILFDKSTEQRAQLLATLEDPPHLGLSVLLLCLASSAFFVPAVLPCTFCLEGFAPAEKER